ncbi:hypothetical protein FTV93_16785 [Escherichia coli]|uniref:Uncharacterized protein n=1 Tax=Escherichia coli TaxID=562 RepID=A0A5B9ANI2_ECOLX|nr:hypothetical protein FTV93_16785 [Escherichia coli]
MPCLFINMKHLYWNQAGIILAGKTKVKRHSKDASQRVSGPLVIQSLQEHITIKENLNSC